MERVVHSPAPNYNSLASSRSQDLPIHVHTHDTAGTGVATQLAAAAAGADIIDCAIDSMSGTTSQVTRSLFHTVDRAISLSLSLSFSPITPPLPLSISPLITPSYPLSPQPSMGAIVNALSGTDLDTGISPSDILPLVDYWEKTRALYSQFEATDSLKSSSSDVYLHEMPGGQYTNLKFQAESLGLGDQWDKVKLSYAAANRVLGDIGEPLAWVGCSCSQSPPHVRSCHITSSSHLLRHRLPCSTLLNPFRSASCAQSRSPRRARSSGT